MFIIRNQSKPWLWNAKLSIKKQEDYNVSPSLRVQNTNSIKNTFSFEAVDFPPETNLERKDLEAFL